MATENVDVNIGETGAGTATLTAAITRMAAAADQLSSSVDRSSAAQRAGSQAASQHASSMGMLQQATGQTRNSFNLLTSALQGYASYLSVSKLIEYADGFTGVQNKLKLTSKDSDQLAASTAEIFKISQATRADFNASASVYVRLQTALTGMNKSTKEAGPLLTTINQAIALSGSTGEAAKGGLEQFQQSLNKGKLSGEEFNSVMVGLPALAAAIAAGMNKPVTALKALADAQQLTSTKVLNALAASQQAVARAFAQSQPTIANAFTYLNNAFEYFIGTQDKANGGSTRLASAIMFLGDNMNIVAPIALTLAGALVLNTIAGAVIGIYGMIKSLSLLALEMAATTLAFVLTPWGAAFTIALIAATAAVYYFRDSIKELTANIPVLGPIIGTVVDWLNKKKTATDGAAGADNSFSARLKEVYEQLNKFTGGAAAATKATTGHGAAAADTTVHLNSYGEKLQSLSDLLKNAADIEKKRTDTINDYMKYAGSAEIATTKYGSTLDFLAKSSDKATGSIRTLTASVSESGAAINQYGIAMETMAGAATSGGQVIQSLVQYTDNLGRTMSVTSSEYDRLTGAVNSNTRSLNDNYTASSRASSTKFTPQTGTITNDSPNDPNAGNFTTAGSVLWPVSYNGQSLGGWTLYASGFESFAMLSQKQAAAQRILDSLPTGTSISAAIAAAHLPAESSSYQYPGSDGSKYFATGGSFMVGGTGGTDSQVVRFNASPDERVTIETPEQVRNGQNPLFGSDSTAGSKRRGQSVVINMQVKTDDYETLRRNQRQLSQDLGKRLSKAVG